jgi:hypothetical protein
VARIARRSHCPPTALPPSAPLASGGTSIGLARLIADVDPTDKEQKTILDLHRDNRSPIVEACARTFPEFAGARGRRAVEQRDGCRRSCTASAAPARLARIREPAGAWRGHGDCCNAI